LDLLLRLVRACGLELRLHLSDEDPSAVPGTRLDFEGRLTELRNLSTMALEARRNVVGHDG